MAREGTRSQTGNAKPRVFQTVDTAPTITRKKTTKAKKADVAVPKGSKPTGVAKKPAAAKKGPSTAAKAKAVVKKGVKKAEGKVVKAEKEAKPKTTTHKKEPVVAK